MQKIRKLLKFLDFHPNVNEVARSLVIEGIFPEQATSTRICILNSDDSLHTIGEYGYSDSFLETTITGEIWRSGLGNSVQIVDLIESGGLWNDECTEFLYVLRNYGSLQGYMTIKFSQPVVDKATSQESIEDICQLVGIFLNGASAIKSNSDPEKPLGSQSEQIGIKAAMTQRQLLILAGMVEGKTNHELAEDLGFSVSTIRHETMRIYENLVVSDRKEAAKKAVALHLI